MRGRPPSFETCFFEQDPGLALRRRAAAEGVGTFLLVLIVTGSGLAAERLWHGAPLPALVAGAMTTAGALVALIVAFGAISGGHFNPLITGLQWLAGERSLSCTLAYVAAQMIGGAAGAVTSAHVLSSGAAPVINHAIDAKVVAGEALATMGLLLIVFGCSRSGRRETGPFAVGAWLAAAIIATPSTSYANPAVTVAALFARGPVTLGPATAAAYCFAEVAAALTAFVVISVLYPIDAPTRHISEEAAS